MAPLHGSLGERRQRRHDVASNLFLCFSFLCFLFLFMCFLFLFMCFLFLFMCFLFQIVVAEWDNVAAAAGGTSFRHMADASFSAADAAKLLFEWFLAGTGDK